MVPDIRPLLEGAHPYLCHAAAKGGQTVNALYTLKPPTKGRPHGGVPCCRHQTDRETQTGSLNHALNRNQD